MTKTNQQKFKERRYLTLLQDDDESCHHLYEFKKGRPEKILKEEYKSLYNKKIVEIDALANTKINFPEPIIVIVVE